MISLTMGKKNKNKEGLTDPDPGEQTPQKRKLAPLKKKKTFLGRCNKLLASILELEYSKPFYSEVDKTKYPDYHSVIRYDINLSRIETKLRNEQYADPVEFGDDVRLLCNNWNNYIQKKEPSSPMFTQINNLSMYFEHEYKKIIDAWKEHQFKKRRIGIAPGDDNAGHSSNDDARHSNPPIPRLMLPTAPSLLAIPTPPHLMRPQALTINIANRTSASLINSLRPGSSTSATSSTTVTVTGSGTGTQIGGSAPSSSSSTTNAPLPLTANAKSPRWTHTGNRNIVSPHTRGLIAGRRETYPGPQGRTRAASTSSASQPPKSPAAAAASPVSGNASSGKSPAAPGGLHTPVLEVDLAATAIWFGEFRHNAASTVHFTDRGIDFSVNVKNKVREFHLGVKDLVRCCGQLGPVASTKKTFFFFLTPAATKRLKSWLRQFTHLSLESCSLIVMYGNSITPEKCSLLLYIFHLLGRASVFGPLFSEVGKEALSLIANIKPGLVADNSSNESSQCQDNVAPNSSTTSSGESVGTARSGSTPKTLNNQSPFNTWRTVANKGTTANSSNLGPKKTRPNQVRRPQIQAASRFAQTQNNKTPPSPSAASRTNYTDLNQNKPNQVRPSIASLSNTQQSESTKPARKDDFASKLDKHIRTRLDSSSDSEARATTCVNSPRSDPPTTPTEEPNRATTQPNVNLTLISLDNTRNIYQCTRSTQPQAPKRRGGAYGNTSTRPPPLQSGIPSYRSSRNQVWHEDEEPGPGFGWDQRPLHHQNNSFARNQANYDEGEEHVTSNEHAETYSDDQTQVNYQDNNAFHRQRPGHHCGDRYSGLFQQNYVPPLRRRRREYYRGLFDNQGPRNFGRPGHPFQYGNNSDLYSGDGNARYPESRPFNNLALFDSNQNQDISQDDECHVNHDQRPVPYDRELPPDPTFDPQQAESPNGALLGCSSYDNEPEVHSASVTTNGNDVPVSYTLTTSAEFSTQPQGVTDEYIVLVPGGEEELGTPTGRVGENHQVATSGGQYDQSGLSVQIEPAVDLTRSSVAEPDPPQPAGSHEMPSGLDEGLMQRAGEAVQVLGEEVAAIGEEKRAPVRQDDDLEIIIPSDSEEELTYVPMGNSSKTIEDCEDLVMTATKVSTKCPVTQQTMLRPLKNKICGHCYDQDGIHQVILNRSGKARCPVPGCSSATPLTMMDMVFDQDLFKFIRAHTTDPKTSEELSKIAVELMLD